MPCTPLGCLMMLRDHWWIAVGNECGGRGAIYYRRQTDGTVTLRDSCTVTIAHSHTRDLANVCQRADILVAAVARPEMITGDFIKPGATVIDVGDQPYLSRRQVKASGDVHYASAVNVAGAITPVPGGVGPMTIACLLANTLVACCRAYGLNEPEGLTA